MALAISEMLRREFAVRAEAATYEHFRQRELDERKRRQREDDAERGVEDAMDIALAVISVAEADEFRIQLDTYDTATVEALQLNDVALAHVRDRLDKLFAKAHVLPDGRRVFKTKDGARVFDEHGQELRAEEIDPQEIVDERPRWKAVKAEMDQLEELERERANILEYHASGVKDLSLPEWCRVPYDNMYHQRSLLSRRPNDVFGAESRPSASAEGIREADHWIRDSQLR
jgi:hypothetical protein